MNTPKKYRKKPVTIKAIRYTPYNGTQIQAWAAEHGTHLTLRDDYLYVATLEGTMKAQLGDWIIKGINGEFYPCKPDIFDATYEEVDTNHDEGISAEKLWRKILRLRG